MGGPVLGHHKYIFRFQRSGGRQGVLYFNRHFIIPCVQNKEYLNHNKKSRGIQAELKGIIRLYTDMLSTIKSKPTVFGVVFGAIHRIKQNQGKI